MPVDDGPRQAWREAWKADREQSAEDLKRCEGERDRYRAALGRIERADPHSYFGRLAAEALRSPDDELASLEDWGHANLGGDA